MPANFNVDLDSVCLYKKKNVLYRNLVRGTGT